MEATCLPVAIDLSSKIEVTISDGYGINMFTRAYVHCWSVQILATEELQEPAEFLEERRVEGKENVYEFTLREFMAYYGPYITPNHSHDEVPIPFDELKILPT